MAAPTQAEYPVGRVGAVCAATGQPLAPGDPYVGALIEDEQGLVRVDYSAHAWDEGSRPEHLFAYWRGTVPDSSRDHTPTLDAGSARELFEQIEGADDPLRIALRYVLALWMMRKRQLLPVDAADHSRDGEVLLVRMRGDDPDAAPIEVVQPVLTDEVQARMTEQVAKLLGISA